MSGEMINHSENNYSNYLQFLPALYREDDFTCRFLSIFEEILSPIEKTIDTASYYFDPEMTPSSFISWLSSWVGMVIDERWPEEKKRQLIKSAIDLYRWRGTRRGLSEHIRLVTGYVPEIVEGVQNSGKDVLVESQSGENQNETKDVMKAHCFAVTLRINKKDVIDADIIRAVIEAQKPAHTSYTLKINK
jgi:phage tail-like protein